jgi:outer membrane receptor protein involved in Fe transport
MGRNFYLTLVLFSGVLTNVFAQSGEIRGQIKERGGKDGVPFASVAALQGGQQIIATVTDLDGNYVLKPLNPGKYDVKATSVGYSPTQTNGVLVTVDKISFVNMELDKGVTTKEVDVVDYKIPLLDKGQTAIQKTVTYEEIQAAPLRDVNSQASLTAGVFQRDEGKELNVRGSRSDGTAYYVDGIKVRGGSSVTSKGAEQITVITGGVPAQYGDATGGIVSVTTRGPSPIFNFGLEGETSTFTDAYDNNRLSASFSGPILSTHDSVGKKTIVAGYFISADYLYDKDPSPSAVGQWVVKPDIQTKLETSPLLNSPTGEGFIKYSDYLTYDSLEHQDERKNVARHAYTINGKLDLHPAKNFFVTLGGTYDYQRYHSFIDIYSLANSYNNNQVTDNQYRVFGKIKQLFGDEESQKNSASVIKHAYYTVQADYTKNTSEDGNDVHMDKLFRYGYVGRYTIHREDLNLHDVGLHDTYLYTDPNNGTTSTIDEEFQDAFVSAPIEYQPYAGSPYTSAYQTQYMDLVPNNFFLSDIQTNGGLVNGDNRLVLNSYDLWALPGRTRTGYLKSENNQFRIVASGSADIRNHNIVLGFEYEQREDRGYVVNPSSLWTLMRGLATSRLTNYEPNDIAPIDFTGDTTIIHQYNYVPTKNLADEYAKGFYENVRDKFGVDYHKYINIDQFSPDDFSLDMFSTDELLGNGLVTYYGYDYKGNLDHGNPSVTDFINNKDGNNNFIRQMGAFRPIYVSGYIQDKFTFNEIIFNVGVRVDRFDANQPVLKDPYTLYPAYTAGSQALKDKFPFYTLPSNISSDAVVYVNNVKNPTGTGPIGFRDGDKWYDAQGNSISDVKNLADQNAAGTGIAPMVQEKYFDVMDKKILTPDAFGDYEPQTTFMPRIAFSFPISDEAFFSAHYDVLTQRPQNADLLRFRPDLYYTLAQGTSINNSNAALKPEKTVDYEISFQQKLSRSSALSFSAFYKELRDMIQIVNVQYAYPIDYSTYGNIDFGTVKGLTLFYDLRRTGNIRMNASYTLQFADGTGSNPASNSRLIAQQGQTNLREPKPLDFDQRHQFTASLDYHYGKGKDYTGPVWFNQQVFSNAGINATVRAGSGTPYTRKKNITPEADFTTAANGRFQLDGQINGSRLPWQFRVDAKVDKLFEVKMGKKANGERRRSYNMGVYVQVLNLFDSRNVIAVYQATGSPTDDGYLATAAAQDDINKKTNPQAYKDQYQIATNNQGNYSLPRRIRLGVQLDF